MKEGVLFPDGSAIGQSVTKQEGEKVLRYEVVGVAGDAKYENLRDLPPPTAYFPMTQDDNQMGTSYNAVVRMIGDREEAAELTQEAFTRALIEALEPHRPPILGP